MRFKLIDHDREVAAERFWDSLPWQFRCARCGHPVDKRTGEGANGDLCTMCTWPGGVRPKEEDS